MLKPTAAKKSRRVITHENAQKQRQANDWLRWLVPLTIFLVTILAFLPALNNGFVGWDDDGNIYDNPHYRGLGWTQLRWMFTTFDMSLYRPVTWATLGADYVVWGMNPFGYHLTSVLLHSGSCVLFYFIARDLLVLARSDANPSDDIPVLIGAAFAALIFAIHPLRVEPVAWVSARNDVVSGLFYLASILCYLRAARLGSNQATRWYWLAAAVIVFGLSLLSKAIGLTLPAVLLVLDIYPLRRLVGGPDKWFGAKVRHIWWEKAPFLLLAFGFGVIALLAKYSTGALRPMQQYFLSYRIGQAFYGLCFYFLKTFVPVNLSPLYELPYDFDTWMPLFVLCGVVVVLITVAVFLSRKRYPALLACWVYYLIVVTPVLGIAQSGPQIVADRYSYLACLSWAILAGGILCHFWKYTVGKNGSISRFVTAPVFGVIVVTLGFLTWNQTMVWRNTKRLWEHVIAVAPDSSIAHFNLGRFYELQSDFEKATQYYQRAVSINPTLADAHYDLARLLAKRGMHAEAIEHYRITLKFKPEAVDAYNNLGLSLVSIGDIQESVAQFQRAVQLNPGYAKGYFNLGRTAVLQGDFEAAIRNFHTALRLSPDEAEIHMKLGEALARQGHQDQAVEHFLAAIKLRPDFADAHVALAKSLVTLSKKDDAEEHYREGLRLLKAQKKNTLP